ncbi:MAG TPA: MgtC/SapB family protein [Nitrolancea sp.]|nr:MgtC/SapB family protein [Nitrolancea sp.]
MISDSEIVLRLAISAALSGVVGLERERLEKSAGLRTHALVGVGATLVMIVSAFGFADVLGTPDVVLDPSRMAAQVVSGIGFLGAGTIIFRRQIVQGLTTAASIWAVAAIGLAVGGGMYLAAAAATVLALLILAGIKPIEHRIFTQRQPPLLTLLVDRRPGTLPTIEAVIQSAGVGIEQIVIEPGAEDHEDRVELTLTQPHSGAALIPLLETLRHIPGVREIRSASSTPPG